MIQSLSLKALNLYSLVLAGLAANGTTKVSGLKHLDRGYDNVEAKLNAVGANLKRKQS